MPDQVEKAIRSTGAQDLTRIARASLGGASVTNVSIDSAEPIGAVHNDARTVGIARVSGLCSKNQSEVCWTSVVKVIDTTIESNAAASWVDPTIEEKVYELGLMDRVASPLRPAKCFGVTHLSESQKLIWLEDLSGAPQPPWTLDQYQSAARHAGAFNGVVAQNQPNLPFDLSVDVHRNRRKSSGYHDGLPSFYENRDHPLIKTALGGVPAETVMELSALWSRVHEVTPLLPHGMAFGDCHARNLFPLQDETVAVDWASISYEPVGADASVLIGSGLSWTVDEAQLIVENERSIFDCYVRGLFDTGWSGGTADVRLAFFTHFPLYLILSAMIPEWMRAGLPEKAKAFVEARYGAPLAELPERLTAVTASIPGYVEEMSESLTRHR